MNNRLDAYKMWNWYPSLAVNSFPTVFVKLKEDEIKALADGDSDSESAKAVIPRLENAMATFLHSRFVSVDLVAPTDTDRFKEKRGAVSSAKSAWRILASSEKVRSSATEGNVSCICVRPFRRMEQLREFRLFIKDGTLKAMSQYWLVRHFARLERRQESYWDIALKFVEQNAWALPLKDLVMDIYFTSSNEIIVLDLNVFGAPTDPLMLNTWKQDWDSVPGIKIVPAPHRLSGDVNVSF